MKTLYFTICLLCIVSMTIAQTATVQIGRYTDCFGRGTCSISTNNNNNRTNQSAFNSEFIKMENGTIILRIHRDKFTKEELTRLMGTVITATNRNKLAFVLEEPVPLSAEVKSNTYPELSNLGTLPAKVYPTKISNSYIDITLVKSN